MLYIICIESLISVRHIYKMIIYNITYYIIIYNMLILLLYQHYMHMHGCVVNFNFCLSHIIIYTYNIYIYIAIAYMLTYIILVNS